MNETIDAYPLSWPRHWPRNQKPQASSFKTGLIDARDGLVRELALLGAKSVVISCNAERLGNGMIAARQRRIDDTGVAVYFTLKGAQKCIPCDKWIRLEDNLRAVELTINALRGLDRWGAKEIVDAAFQGFTALPEATGVAAWWDELGVAPSASNDEIDTAYRRLIKQHHPDVGGDVEAFRRVTEAYRQAKETSR